MNPNIHFHSAHLRGADVDHLAGGGYIVDADGVRQLRRMYRLVRRATGSATLARVWVLGLLNVGRSSQAVVTDLHLEQLMASARETHAAVAA